MSKARKFYVYECSVNIGYFRIPEFHIDILNLTAVLRQKIGNSKHEKKFLLFC